MLRFSPVRVYSGVNNLSRFWAGEAEDDAMDSYQECAVVRDDSVDGSKMDTQSKKGKQAKQVKQAIRKSGNKRNYPSEVEDGPTKK